MEVMTKPEVTHIKEWMVAYAESVRDTTEHTMNRWIGKVAVVTGASSGIGVEVSKSLTSQGIIVVGLARRLPKLRELATEIGKNKFYPVECDVTKEEDILKAFKWVEKQLGGVDILVNNAGVVTKNHIIGKIVDVDFCSAS